MSAPLRLIGLLLAGYTAAGCIPVPGNGRPMYGGLRPEEKIGTTDASPLRLNRSTRENAVSVLGLPSMVTIDGRTFAYRYTVAGWTQLWIVPFGATPLTDWLERFLLLDFDAAGTLVSSRPTADGRVLYHSMGPRRFVDYHYYRRSRGAAEGEIPLPPLNAPDESDAPTTQPGAE